MGRYNGPHKTWVGESSRPRTVEQIRQEREEAERYIDEVAPEIEKLPEDHQLRRLLAAFRRLQAS